MANFKRFSVLIFLTIASLSNKAQQHWVKNFDLFLGYGIGIGDVNSGTASSSSSNQINHFAPSISIEYSDYVLPISLEYDITVSRYLRKGTSYSISSQYFVHKIGLGYKIKDDIPLKLKYIIRNHYFDIFSEINHGIQTSIGIERNKRLNQLFPKREINLTYRLMLYFEHTFAVFDGLNRNNSLFRENPYRNITGVSIWVKPWKNKLKKNIPKDILPPL